MTCYLTLHGNTEVKLGRYCSLHWAVMTGVGFDNYFKQEYLILWIVQQMNRTTLEKEILES